MGRGALSLGARSTNERPNRRGVLTLTSRMALLLRWLPIGAGLMGLWLAASPTAHAHYRGAGDRLGDLSGDRTQRMAARVAWRR